ncbi:serpin family protein [Flammeovirga sp. SubArs3]|uniref:serpin family protein n=1 Tax=Flammeovirga sp. SubArs3 TaxID=2995316 RepID=UPI00248D04B1|nr:serpin family protein [Flammeovirga sp. SubArs3]
MKSKLLPLFTSLLLVLNTIHVIAQDNWMMLKQIHKNENVVISPYSVNSALGMLSMVTSDETQQEILNYLEVKDEKQLKKKVEAKHQLFTTKQNVDLSIANGIWYDKQYKLIPTTKKDLISTFGAEIKGVNFYQSEKVKTQINDWVDKKTEGEIDQIISEVTKDDHMILVNTVFFDAEWSQNFDEKATRKGDFKLTNGEVKQIDFLTDNARFTKNYSDDNIKVLSLIYKEAEFELVLLMPTQGKLEEFLDGLNEQKVLDYQSRMKPSEVFFKMPKTEITFEKDLIANLKSSGIERAFFSGQAQFGNFSKSAAKDLYVSQVMHKTVVTFSESGTKAAAATAISVSRSALNPKKKEFYFNQPFIFLIQEVKTKEVLFMGTVETP